MGLATRDLDDRTFQEIKNDVMKRIRASCPEWTDHNVSDPGVTLVELFAWMMEMVLYRLNVVPEKNYVKFLELLGIQLEPPEPARTEITFYLSAPQLNPVLIARETQVATVRTGTRPAVIFSTDADLEVHPPVFKSLRTRITGRRSGKISKFVPHNLKLLERGLDLPGVAGAAFGNPPKVGDALYFGFENNVSHYVLGIEVDCQRATGMGILPDDPPWEWEARSGGEGENQWSPVVVESDTTGGLNQSGMIRVRLPRMAPMKSTQDGAYVLRCKVVPNAGNRNYGKSPVITRLVVKSWGGSVTANHAAMIREEVLGRSDGAPGQVFQAQYGPLLKLTRDETIEVQAPGQTTWDRWTEVPDFADSGPEDKHFVCETATGEVRFGPALRLPGGAVHAFGAIPPRGALIRFSAYRHGGGAIGNVQAGMLSVLKTSIPYVDNQVINHAEARGGTDLETLDMAMMRARKLMRSGGRAVTAADYEQYARAADPRVERAYCIQPTAADAHGGLSGGTVYLLIVPRVSAPHDRIALDRLRIPPELNLAVQSALDRVRLLGVTLEIREPAYYEVVVEINVTAVPTADTDRVREDVERRLYNFLNPITGGPDGTGWPFGRKLYTADVYGCLRDVPGIAFVGTVKLMHVEPSGEQEIKNSLDVVVRGLVVSGQHRVAVVKQKL